MPDRRGAIIVMGRPGSGKGTQSRYIAAATGGRVIDLGLSIRRFLSEASDPASETRNKGGYVAPSVSEPLLIAELEAAKLADLAVVLDGYPRKVSQVERLEHLLAGRPVVAAISIHIRIATALDRAQARQVCGTCFAPAEEGQPQAAACRSCPRGRLQPRADDELRLLRERLEIYEVQSEAIAAAYSQAGIYRVVDGEQRPDSVSADVLASLRRLCPELLADDDDRQLGLFRDAGDEPRRQVQQAGD